MKINTNSGINTELIKQGHLDWLQCGRKREVGALYVGLSCCKLRKALTESCLYFCNAYSMMRVMNPYCFHLFLTIWSSAHPKKHQPSYGSLMQSLPSPFLHDYQQKNGNRGIIIRYHSHQINPLLP